MRILFDANVLINGVLLPQSQSRKVIEKLNHDTFKGFVCQNTLDEIQGAFIRAYRNTGVDLTHIFMSTIRFLPIIFLPRVSIKDRKCYPGIRGIGDKTLLEVAKTLNLIICTNDIGDFKQTHSYGVTVKTPNELTDDGKVSLDRIVLGIFALPEQGTIYIEAMPHWAGADINILKRHMNGFIYLILKGLEAYIMTSNYRLLCTKEILGKKLNSKLVLLKMRMHPLR